MAEWEGASRSNYFRVKDRAGFEGWLEEVEDVQLIAERDGCVAIAGCDGGGWPVSYYRDDEDEEFDYVDALAGHLADGEVAVLVETGSENLRYITGRAVAVHSTGKCVTIELDEIYERAAAAFDQRPSDAAF